ncbi:hypothetical protein GCM10023065_13370 [Microbacterium laevaniformans]|nr:hypothetical protein [Microbacterium laevaniformans]GLJ64659.1 hypothetical protein GCM10017578_15480 [Microbacterium laevaniformans]
MWCDQMGIGGWVGMIAAWAAVLAVVVWAVRRMFPAPSTPISDPKALLDARLAQGEIDLVTYQNLRAAVNDSMPATMKGTR